MTPGPVTGTGQPGTPPGHLLVPLRVGVVALCLGSAASVLAESLLPDGWLYSDRGSLGEAMFEVFDVNDVVIDAVVRGGSWAMLALAVLALFRRSWPVLPLASLWLLLGVVGMLANRELYWQLAPFSQATRYCAPVALAVLCAGAGNGRSLGIVAGILRVALAATFAAHGLEAWFGIGEFHDLLQAMAGLLGIVLQQDTVAWLLSLIGVIDVLAAVAVLLPWRWQRLVRPALAYMVVWGIGTAVARLANQGVLQGMPDLLIRVVHGVVPLALLLHATRCPAVDRDS